MPEKRKKILFFGIIFSLIIGFLLCSFIVSFVLFPTNLKETFRKAGVKKIDVNEKFSLSSRDRFTWGELSLNNEDLKKVVSYLGMKEFKFTAEEMDKFAKYEEDFYGLTDEETKKYDDYVIVKKKMEEIKRTTKDKWTKDSLRGYSFYYIGDTPDKLSFFNGSNFTFLFIAINPETGKGIYLACYAFG